MPPCSEVIRLTGTRGEHEGPSHSQGGVVMPRRWATKALHTPRRGMVMPALVFKPLVIPASMGHQGICSHSGAAMTNGFVRGR